MSDGVTFRLRARGSYQICDNRYDTPAVRRVRSGLWRGRRVAQAVAAVRNAKDADERAYLVEAFADWWSKPRFLQRTVKDDELILIRGVFGVKRAWRARGGGWTPKHFPEFQARLRYAEADLLHAAQALPADPVAPAWLIVCYRGLQSPSSGEDAFKEAVRRDRTLRFAHSALLWNKTPSWYGSEEEAAEFVQASVRAQPRLKALVPELYAMVPTSVADDTLLWARPEVAASVLAANKAVFPDGHAASMESLRARNWFAYALWRTGQHAAAAPHLAVLGRRPQILPWGQAHPLVDWLSNRIHKARRECRRAVTPPP